MIAYNYFVDMIDSLMRRRRKSSRMVNLHFLFEEKFGEMKEKEHLRRAEMLLLLDDFQ